METEKVCVNLSGAELGAIDVLVAQGLFTSRSDVIRSGIREVTERHAVALERVTKHATCIGVMALSRSYLEEVVREGKRLRIVVVGIFRLADDVTPDLADSAIDRAQVLGSVRAPQAVLDRLGDRVARNLEGTSWL
jgi:Arc/MetJ-type ribon-helix-helix transcriptional regulator